MFIKLNKLKKTSMNDIQTSKNSKKTEKIREIYNDPMNNSCFDCGKPNPEYISANNGVFICNNCMLVHYRFNDKISLIIKNNLYQLNDQQINYLFNGGNRYLLEFISNYFPQLENYKPELFYRTIAMQYYRELLFYLVEGGNKPILPNQKIGYKLLNSNSNYAMTEKRAKKSLINKKRNVQKFNLSEEKSQKMNSNNSQLNINLSKRDNFFNEMNKIFGDNPILEEENENNNVTKSKLNENNSSINFIYNKSKNKVNNWKFSENKKLSQSQALFPFNDITNYDKNSISKNGSVHNYKNNDDSIESEQTQKHKKIKNIYTKKKLNSHQNSEIHTKCNSERGKNKNDDEENIITNNVKVFNTLGSSNNYSLEKENNDSPQKLFCKKKYISYQIKTYNKTRNTNNNNIDSNHFELDDKAMTPLNTNNNNNLINKLKSSDEEESNNEFIESNNCINYLSDENRQTPIIIPDEKNDEQQKEDFILQNNEIVFCEDGNQIEQYGNLENFDNVNNKLLKNFHKKNEFKIGEIKEEDEEIENISEREKTDEKKKNKKCKKVKKERILLEMKERELMEKEEKINRRSDEIIYEEDDENKLLEEEEEKKIKQERKLKNLERIINEKAERKIMEKEDNYKKIQEKINEMKKKEEEERIEKEKRKQEEIRKKKEEEERIKREEKKRKEEERIKEERKKREEERIRRREERIKKEEKRKKEEEERIKKEEEEKHRKEEEKIIKRRKQEESEKKKKEDELKIEKEKEKEKERKNERKTEKIKLKLEPENNKFSHVPKWQKRLAPTQKISAENKPTSQNSEKEERSKLTHRRKTKFPVIKDDEKENEKLSISSNNEQKPSNHTFKVFQRHLNTDTNKNNEINKVPIALSNKNVKEEKQKQSSYLSRRQKYGENSETKEKKEIKDNKENTETRLDKYRIKSSKTHIPVKEIVEEKKKDKSDDFCTFKNSIRNKYKRQNKIC